jgi:hypothetical protein
VRIVQDLHCRDLLEAAGARFTERQQVSIAEIYGN